MDGFVYAAGAATSPFTIQELSKPFVYALALAERGFDEVASRVGLRPTEKDPFTAITLEPGTGRPRNPMVDAGALLTASLVGGTDEQSSFEQIRAGLSAFAGRDLGVDEKAFQSAQEAGDRDRAIAYLMRSTGVLDGDIDEICSVYLRQRAVLVTCSDLAVMAGTLARGGVNPLTGEQVLTEDHARQVLAVMGTCGMYDDAGPWMLRVGFPAKSGATGGICAVLPGQLGIGTFSPRLDSDGNSARGVLACGELSRRFGLNMLSSAHFPAHPVHTTYRAGMVTSKRIRPPRDRELLRTLGSTIVIHELQGDLGFVTTERVVRTIREHLAGVRWIVLDMRRVAAIDKPAIALLRVLMAELAERQLTTLFADPHGIPELAMLEHGEGSVDRLRDCETALARAEDALLLEEGTPPIALPTDRVPFGSLDLLAELTREDVAALRTATETRTYKPGDVVFAEGDPADGMYLVTRGMVNVEVNASRSGRRFRLNTVQAGNAFGELALVDGGARTSRVVAAEATECEMLSIAAFERLRHQHPRIADALYPAIARSLAARLRHSTREIQMLET
jgi:glutaminase